MNAPQFTGATAPVRAFRWPAWVRTYLLDRAIRVTCLRCVDSEKPLIQINDQPVEWVMTQLERAVQPHLGCVSYREAIG